jgi:hypothetical protein
VPPRTVTGIIDDVRTSQELRVCASTDSYGDSFTLVL